MLPKISNYGQYSSDNYGAHSLCVDFGPMEVYYSYETIIAYRDAQDGLTVCENVWTVTTGKHLNWINRDKTNRKPAAEFDAMLQAALKRHIN